MANLNQAGAANVRWRGGKTTMGLGYVGIRMPEHPRASRGYVLEHVLVAEKALGRPLPVRAKVHHVNEDKADNRGVNLVICEDHAYHMLLHYRARALAACGDANYLRCEFCNLWDDPAALYIRPSRAGAYHRACRNHVQQRRRHHVPCA